MPRQLRIQDFTYELPNHRIARYPAPRREEAKLLIYRPGEDVRATTFRQVAAELPAGTLLVTNETRVVHARIPWTLPTGKPLEIFCLDPIAPADYEQNFAATDCVAWKCLVGGNRRWKSASITAEFPMPELGYAATLTATRGPAVENAYHITFSWNTPAGTPAASFARVLAAAGQVPLPPYLSRDPEAVDDERYQSVFAHHEGSVAAPTASLHFTPELLAELAAKDVRRAGLTLHVGAGTFQPVSADIMADHPMHAERFRVSREFLERLHDQLQSVCPVVCVGTTAARTLESLYWLGERLLATGKNLSAADLLDLQLDQWTPYEEGVGTTPPATAVQQLIDLLKDAGGDALSGQTSLIIAPGYRPRLLDGLFTNFHQPHSTLLLLVAACIGPAWREVYDYALEHDFRFLSYGDGSLLWCGQPRDAG